MASGSIFSGSPTPSAKSLASKRPPSQLSLYDGGGGGGTPAQKSDAELEAERLWWSEASERQVKELESSFGSAFRKTAEKLSSDVASCKDRLEMLIEAERKQRATLLSDLSMDVAARMDRLEVLVESEKGQRHTASLELKRGLDAQELALRELEQAQQQALERLEGRLEDKLHDVLRELSSEKLVAGSAASADQAEIQDAHRLLNKLRSDFDSFQVQVTSKDATFMADWAYNKSQVSTLEGVIEDLQRKLGGEKKEEHAAAAIEASVADIRRDLTVVQETQKLCEAQASSASQEQVVALENTVSDLRRFQDAQQTRSTQADSLIEELRREAEALRTAADARARTDEEVRSFHEVIMQSTCDLGRGLEEISATVVVAEEKLRKEIEELRARGAGPDVAEALDASSSRLAKSIEEERASRSGEITALSTRLDVALEQLERPQAQPPGMVTKADLEKLRGVVEVDVQTLRGHVEALGGEIKSLGEEASRVRSADVAGVEAKREAEGLLATCRERLGGLERDLERRLDEERTVRMAQMEELQRITEASVALRQAENDKPQVVVTAHPAESGLSKVVDEVRNDLCNLKVAMQVLEERCPETDVYQTQAQELRAFSVRLDQADGEVQRVTGCVGALSARVDACENEVWRTSSETPVFMTRLDVMESDMKRLLRESTTSGADVVALRSMLGDMKVEEGMLKAEAKSPSPAVSPPLPISPPASWEHTAPQPFPSVVPNSSANTTAAGSSGPLSEPEPSTAPPPMLSADLKASIGKLVQRVNATLTARPMPEVANPVARAALALQELRERNVSLREENAGLVEELLQQPAAATPAAPVLHIGGGSYVPSAAPPPWAVRGQLLTHATAPAVPRYSVDGAAPRAVHASAAGGSVAVPVSLVPPSAASGGSVLVPPSAASGGSVLIPPSAASGGSVLIPPSAASGGPFHVGVGGGGHVPPLVTARDASPVRSARVASPVRRYQSSTRHGSVIVHTTQAAPYENPERA